MNKFPIRKQPDSMDCGPACICMIAEYYGKKFRIETMRSSAFIGRDGVSLLGISKAAEMVGLRTVGGRITFNILAEKAVLPCIIHWNQEHFVVVYKIKKSRKGYKVYIADPARGQVEYTQEEFCEHWLTTKTNNENKGVVLLLEPTNEFYAKENDIQNNNHFEFLWKYLVQFKRYFLQITIGLLIGSLLQLLFPFLTQSIVDIGINGKDISFVWLILIAQLMLLFSKTAIGFIRNKILLHISTRINVSLISDFFIKLMKLPMKFFDTKLTGDLIQRIEDHKRIEKFITAQTINLLFSIFSFVIFGIVLLYYNLVIFSVFIIGSAMYALWIIVFLKKRRQLDYKLFEQEGLNRNIVYQMISGMQEIKLQGCEQRKRWEWEDIQADLFNINLEVLSLKQIQEAGSICINETKNILITVVAAMAVIDGSLTIGMMLAIQYIIGQLNTPVEQLVAFIYHWQDVSISLDRMNEIHTQTNEENENKTISQLELKASSFQIENLYFKYNNALPRYTLRDICLNIPHGKTTAIVGASGSGKTTLLKLLLGYYDLNRGSIRVAGESLDKFNLSWWRTQCGVVMQEGYLFSDTIANNIAVSDDKPDLEKIRYAATIANIAEDIEKLPLAYNTKIGQDGQSISQGQKQRILIARVVYKNPSFVFLDEATNALDANNERAILSRLEEFYKDKTVVVVAHRLSTVQNAHNIVVLDGGEIAEQGTHNELTQKRGLYYHLVKNQLELGN
ncbi:MAG: peptidase domain-containing ABC transporter [Tannerellaceae bacterium]